MSRTGDLTCDIIIAVWNLKEKTSQCIESIIEHTESPYRLIVVDDASGSPTKEYLEGLKNDKRIAEYVLIRNQANLGATKSFNRGMQASTAGYVLLLNNDTVVTPGWLREMVAVAEKDSAIGIVNPASNNLGQHVPANKSLVEYAKKRRKKYKGESIEMAAAVGFCYLMKRQVLDSIGLWNEQYGLGYFEETEHCIKARRAGYRIVMAKASYVYHYEKSSFKMISDYEKLFEENQAKFEEVFGRSRRLLYVLTRDDRMFLASLRTNIREKANDRAWIHVFRAGGVGDAGFGEHTNIKIFGPRCFAARWIWLARVIKKKKKYDEICVDSQKLLKFFKRFRFLHRASVRLLDAGDQSPLKVVDVGCGGAKIAGAVGIDLSPAPGVDVVADLDRYPWPFRNDSFDVLNCNNVVEHINDVVKTMEELHRIGKNGAVIIIDTCHFAHPNSYRDPTHKWHFTLGTFDYFTGDIEYPRYSSCTFRMLKKEFRFKKKHCRGRLYAFFSPRRYEKYYCHSCPPDSLHFELEIVK